MNALRAFFLLAALAALAPLWSPGSASREPALSDPPEIDPAEFARGEWTPVPLAAREARFARDFPGRIAVFATPEGRTLVVRHVARPTRKLHPASDCLRAVGYAITPRPIYLEPGGREWSESLATRDGESLRVRERLLGADGRAWTDVSAWFWSAALGRASGPWWSITELSPE